MLLLTDALVWQEDRFLPLHVLIDRDRIAHLLPVGSPSIPEAKVISLAGSYIYPGFIDTHTHSFEGGLYSLGTDLQNVPSIPSLLDRLHVAYTASSTGDVLFAWQLDETTLREQRFPTLAELDSVCPDRALILRRIDGHSCMLNTFARRQLPEIMSYGEILRGAENDHAVHCYHARVSDEQVLAAYSQAAKLALKGGFTGLHTMVGDAANSIGHYRLLQASLDSFPIHYTLYPQSFNLEAALEVGAKRIGGCILADGSIGSGTAALSSPYTGTDNTGVLYHDNDFWYDFVSKAHKHHLQVAVHCIGNAAIRQINRTYARVQHDHPQDLRHELIHCEITPDDLVQEIVHSNAVPVMQPNFDLLWGGEMGFYARKLGIERSRIMNRFATFTQAGVKITGGSDWYITALDAVASIRAAMQHHNPAERLTHAQSVDIYTRNAAWLSHEEEQRGQIKAGYLADLTILTHALDDPQNLPQVRMVITGGQISYEG